MKTTSRSRIASRLLGVAALAALPSASAQVIRRITSDNGDPIRDACFLTEYDGRLFFRANNIDHGNNVELWSFDGTVARMAAEIRPGTSGSDPIDLTVCNGTLYFGADGGSGIKLWQYTAATGATVAPGAASQAMLPEGLIAYAGALYFRATRFSDIGIEFWKFDGVNQTPIDLYPGSGSSYPQHFIEFNELLYFNANGTPGQGTELWRTNGAGRPTEATRIYPGNGSSPENFAVFNGQLYFSAYDGVHGRELWRFDGTTATLAADIVPGGQNSSSNPSGLTVYGGKLYFSATDAVHGCELWSFDGTRASMVAEINSTPDPGDGDTFLMDSSPNAFTVFDGKLYFSAIDGTHGRELWSYDGASVQLVMDVNPGPYGSEIRELTVFRDVLYFSANDGSAPGLGSLQPAVFALAAAPRVAMDLAIQSAAAGSFMLTLANSDGSAVTPAQMAKVQILTAPDPGLPIGQWQVLPNPLVLAGGIVEVHGLESYGEPNCFYRAAMVP